jgi:transposase, IS5 family
MAHKKTGQASFVEAFLRPDVGANRRLERIERMIDWAPLAVLVKPVRSGAWGRPSYPPLSMLKALLLQRWYALSDEGLEEALSDRLSFRRFCGFALDDETPDGKTLCRFRLALVEADLPERLFAELDRQLAAKGLFIKTGTLIDASLIEADVKRPPKEDGEVAKRDPDAGFTRRGQKSFFGYKAHIAVDQGTDLIRGAILTGADVGDSLVADALIQGDERAVYADRAYDSRARREALAEAGIGDALMHRRHPRRRQPAWQKWMNVALTPIRCQVERLFGLMKRSYGYRRVRYRGLARNRAQLLLMCMAINLRRADRLLAG